MLFQRTERKTILACPLVISHCRINCSYWLFILRKRKRYTPLINFWLALGEFDGISSGYRSSGITENSNEATIKRQSNVAQPAQS